MGVLGRRCGYLGDDVATNIMVEGLRPKFHTAPSLSREPGWNAMTSEDQAFEILKFIPDWLEKGIVREMTDRQTDLYFSRMFTVLQKNGKRRPILDLSVLNRLICTPKFRMETLEKIVRFIRYVMWGTSVDLTDAFFHVPIHPDFQKFFAFKLGRRTFVFLKMPFGLTTAPWAFSRVMKPIKAFPRRRGVRIFSFLDDFLILAVSFHLSKKHTNWTLVLLEWLNFRINKEKSSFHPLQKLEYLGVILDLRSLTLSLPHDKVEKVLSICRQGRTDVWMTRRELERLVGFLNFTTCALSLGRLHLIPLIRWMNSHTTGMDRDLPVPLDKELKEALFPWLDREFLRLPVPMNVPDPTLDLMTDASDFGWSGVLLPYQVNGVWTQEELSYSINWRELKAVQMAVLHFVKLLMGKSVRILSDSQVALSCIHQQGSKNFHDLYNLYKELLVFCRDHQISLVPVHIKGVLNVLADQGSRYGPISTEWSLDQQSFSWICRHFRIVPEVDLFATRVNSKLPSFISPCPDEMALAWDARFLNWNRFGSLYVFPPLNLLPDAVMRLERFRGSGFVIAPMWRTRDWFPILGERCPIRVPLPRGYTLSAHLQRSGSDGRAMEPLGMASVRSLSVSRMWSIDIPSLVQEVESVDSLVSRSSATQTHDQVLGIGSYPSHLKTNRLRAIAFGLRRKRFGKQAVDLILTQHRPSTCRQYQMVWDKFLDFLRVRGISHDEVGANSVADFLAFYAVSLRRAYRTVAGYKCAVAEPLYANFGISLETREIKALLRGVYARRPPPKDGLMPGWCLSDLLEYLRGPPFDPLETAGWGALIKKTLVLFLLASGRRISEISEIQHVSCRKGNKVILKWLPLFRAKWESADFHPEQPSVSRLVPLPGGDILLCPVRAWGVFVRKRMTIRNYMDNDRFWPCSMYALSYFCKRVVKDSVKFAGKSVVGPVGPHQFRKLAGSLSRKFFTDSERVLYNKMGSKSMSVLTRSYIRDVSRVRHSCVVPLGTLYPNTRLVRDLPKKS